MGSDFTVTVEPGLADMRDGSAPYSGARVDFLRSVGAKSLVAQEFRETSRGLTDQPSESAGTLWASVVTFFAAEYSTVVDVVQQPVELAAYWLHVPDVEGAAAKLTASREKSIDSVTSMTIAGMGGGPRFTVKGKAGISYPTDRPRRAVLTADGVFQKIEVTKQNQVMGTYARLVALDVSDRTWSFPDLDRPGPADLGEVVERDTYSPPATGKPLEVTYTVTRGTEVKSVLGLKLDQFGIDASTSMTIGYTSEATLAYTLPQGRTSTLTRYANYPTYFWD